MIKKIDVTEVDRDDVEAEYQLYWIRDILYSENENEIRVIVQETFDDYITHSTTMDNNELIKLISFEEQDGREYLVFRNVKLAIEYKDGELIKCDFVCEEDGFEINDYEIDSGVYYIQ